MNVKLGFIFDVDGTLIDSVDLHAHAWQESLAHFGFHVGYQDVRSQIGKGGDHLLPVFVPADQLDRLQEPIEKHRGELFKREYLPKAKAFPRVRDLFQRIQRDGHRIVLASSAVGDELNAYKKLANIDDLLDAETSRDDVEHSKPSPDIFEVALQRLGPARSRALVFGDSPYDAIAARRAGVRTVGLLCGGFPEGWLREAGCVALYRDPADLLERYDEVLALFTPAPQTP